MQCVKSALFYLTLPIPIVGDIAMMSSMSSIIKELNKETADKGISVASPLIHSLIHAKRTSCVLSSIRLCEVLVFISVVDIMGIALPIIGAIVFIVLAMAFMQHFYCSRSFSEFKEIKQLSLPRGALCCYTRGLRA